MKKLLMLLALLLLPTLGRADVGIIDTLKSLPGFKQGVAFDVTESEFNYLTTIGIIKYNDVGISAGYSGDDKIVATLTYNLGGLKRFGIDTPITNLIDIEAGYYFGFGRIGGDNETSHGPVLTIVNVKF